MSDPSARKQAGQDAVAVNKIVFLSAAILDVLVVMSVWDDPLRRWLVIALCVVLILLNAVVFPRLYAAMNIEDNSFRLREYGNGLGQAVKVVLANASLPTWGWLIILAAVVDRERKVWATHSIIGLLVVQVATSVYVGVGWIQIVTLAALVLLAMELSTARSHVLLAALDEQERQRNEIERGANELRQMQKLATQQEKMSSLGMLAAGIAHEINNPMALVTSSINQLENDLPELSRSEELMKEYEDEVIPEIKEGIVRVNTIVNDLRRFARGDVEFRSTFDVNDVVRSAVRMTHGRVSPGVSLSLSLAEIPPQKGLPTQLSQVVINLLVNAIQAVDIGGVITVQTGCEKDVWWLTVADTGPGMDEETRSKIFEPFFTTRPLGEGTGLGLAVVHGIVEKLKGQIGVESTQGEGATFRLTVPLDTDTEAARHKSGAGLSTPREGSLPPSVACH